MPLGFFIPHKTAARLGILALAGWCWGCALKVEDPVAEVQEKIGKSLPLTDSLLRGEWAGDSTYTLRDTRAVSLAQDRVTWLIFRDGRYRILDPGSPVFDMGHSGRLVRRGDSLLLTGDDGKTSVYIGQLTFRGNYLSLYQPRQLRHSFFHRIPAADSQTVATYLEGGFFMRTETRDSLDRITREKLTGSFEYWRFSAGAWSRAVWRRGLPARDSGTYAVRGDTLSLAGSGQAGSTPVDFVIDRVRRDSLRLWPLRQGGADSGYAQLARRDSLPPWHRDLTPCLGYWRGDTVSDDSGTHLTDFEQFADLALQPSGQLAATTLKVNVPAWNSWDLDSGLMVLTGPGGLRHTFAAGVRIQGQDTLLYLQERRQSTAGRSRQFIGTRRDGSGWAQDPTLRFPDRSHAVLRFGTGSAQDTLLYLSLAGWSERPERAEFALRTTDANSLAWVILALPATAVSTSDQTGFIFKAEGRNASLGRFLCVARPDLALTLRLQTEIGSRLYRGTLQGRCRIEAAEHAPTDSVLAVEGDFVVTRQNAITLRSGLW